MRSAEIIQGDCLKVLPRLATSSVDLIATDPPFYRVKGEKWDRQWKTPALFLAWLDRVLVEFERVLKPNGSLYLFASPDMAARVEVLIRGRFVPLAEFKRQRADEPDLWRHRWTQGGRQSDHKAEKPVDLLRRACRLVAAPGALIVDPFCGSGSTGVAAIAEGMRFIGIERDAEHVETARRRLRAPRPAAPVTPPKQALPRPHLEVP